MSELEPSVAFKPGSSNENGQIIFEDNKTTTLNQNAADVLNPTGVVENKLEDLEIADKISPIKQNYDNKAFELEDVDINNSHSDKNPFDRQARPGSMISIRTSASTSSRSSVNCTSGRVRCPNLRLKKFFSYKAEGGFQRASEDCKQIILPEKDGNFIGNWLLVEISTWDLHREKVVLLTEKTLIVVSYDFIKLRINDYKRISLTDLKKVVYGNLKYPPSSMMGEYSYGACKLIWGDENQSFFNKWNPLGNNPPFITFTSHHIIYNEKEKESQLYNCDEFISSLEFVISKLPNDSSNIEFKEEPIQIESYASALSVLYNQNWIGFQLDRNGINF